MDPETIVVALIGALGGGAIAGITAIFRSKTTLRTAARLIYAELTANAAPIAYFSVTGTWPSAPIARSAWDKHGEQLARRWGADLFSAVHRGYGAVDAISYLGENAGRRLSPELLSSSITYLQIAIRAAADKARIPTGEVAEQVRLLTLPSSAHRAGQEMIKGAPSLYIQFEVSQLAAGAAPPIGLSQRAEVDRRSQPPADMTRFEIRIFDCHGRTSTETATLVRTRDSAASGDPQVESVYEALKTGTGFLSTVFGRESLDGTSDALDAFVHYGESFANAYWSGSALVVGDGDGERFQTFALVDVLTHELCHSMSELSHIVYQGQSGALLESICDVMGILAKQWSMNQSVGESDWILGAGVYGASVNGGGLRSMRAPGTAYDDPVLGRDPQFPTMRDYVETSSDAGGVHVNLGIPNHAFYLASEPLGGHAWDTTGRIWYESLSRLGPTREPTFADFAQITIDISKQNYGSDSAEHRAVREAWQRVGVLNEHP